MRQLTLAFLLLCCAAPAGAQGLNLTWNDCTLGLSAQNKNDPCNADIGAPHRFVVSMEPSRDPIDQVIGVTGVITLRFDSAAVPAYWQMQPGGVRAGALQIDPFIGWTSPPFSCPEPWSQAGGAVATVNYSLGPGPNQARIDFTVDAPGPMTLDWNIAPDWYIAAFDILRDGTTTAGGCAAPACVQVDYVLLRRTPGAAGGDIPVCAPAVSQAVTWQGFGPLACPFMQFPPPPGPPQCPGATPTLEPTWGRLKQMYR